MKIFCLGGGGRICRESILDLVFLSIGAQLIAAGQAGRSGAVPPELAFDAETVFAELARREIQVHHEVHSLPAEAR